MELLQMYLLLVLACSAWIVALRGLWIDNREPGSGARHRRPGLARMRRSGTKPRRRATSAQSEHTLAA